MRRRTAAWRTVDNSEVSQLAHVLMYNKSRKSSNPTTHTIETSTTLNQEQALNMQLRIIIAELALLRARSTLPASAESLLEGAIRPTI